MIDHRDDIFCHRCCRQGKDHAGDTGDDCPEKDDHDGFQSIQPQRVPDHCRIEDELFNNTIVDQITDDDRQQHFRSCRSGSQRHQQCERTGDHRTQIRQGDAAPGDDAQRQKKGYSQKEKAGGIHRGIHQDQRQITFQPAAQAEKYAVDDAAGVIDKFFIRIGQPGAVENIADKIFCAGNMFLIAAVKSGKFQQKEQGKKYGQQNITEKGDHFTDDMAGGIGNSP